MLEADSARWHRATPSTSPWEDEAIDFLRSSIADVDSKRRKHPGPTAFKRRAQRGRFPCRAQAAGGLFASRQAAFRDRYLWKGGRGPRGWTSPTTVRLTRTGRLSSAFAGQPLPEFAKDRVDELDATPGTGR